MTISEIFVESDRFVGHIELYQLFDYPISTIRSSHVADIKRWADRKENVTIHITANRF